MAGKPSPEETSRNEQLIADLNSGEYSTVELVAKYKISTARIYQIKKQYDKKSN